MLAAINDTLKSLPMSTMVTGGGAAVVAFLAGLAFTNGVMKQLINMVCIAGGVAVSWYCLRHRADMFGPSAASMGTDRLVMFSGIAGLIGFGVCRVAMSLLGVFGIFRLFGGLAGWRGVALSLIPSGFLLWTSSMGLRLVGNLYGMETAAAMGREGTRITSSFGGIVDSLRRALEKSSIGSIMLDVDPLAMRPTANLTRLLIVWPDQRIWPQLKANPKTAAIFSHPKVAALGYDATVRKFIDAKDYAGLMQLPKVEQTAAYPDLQPLLSDVALEDAMDQILYGRAPVKK
jgi:hypothetical protein